MDTCSTYELHIHRDYASIDSKLDTKPPHSESELPPSFTHTAVDFKVGLGLPAISYTACKRVCHT